MSNFEIDQYAEGFVAKREVVVTERRCLYELPLWMQMVLQNRRADAVKALRDATSNNEPEKLPLKYASRVVDTVLDLVVTDLK